MSSRGASTVTILAVGCAFVLAITLLVFLQKSQHALETSQIRLHQAEGGYIKMKQQFDALREYKDRLEKSFMTYKTEKASQYLPNFSEGESHGTQIQIQLLQDELKECRERERDAILSGRTNTISLNNHKGVDELIPPSHQVPITSSPSTPNRQLGPELRSPASALAEELKQHLNSNSMKEAIQSPIGHVPPVPAVPSGDPNEDLAGNVII